MHDFFHNIKILGISIVILFAVPAIATAVTFTGNILIQQNLAVGGSLSKGGGTFAIDHPLDPANKILTHSFVESPDVMNVYDGVVSLNNSGEATITFPDYFEALNMDFTYQYTAIGAPAPGLYIKEEVANNQFTIAGGEPGVSVSWQVTGIRHDPYIEANPIETEVEKGPDALVEKGEYVFPEFYTATSTGE